MTPLVDTDGGTVFVGSVDDADAVEAVSAIACGCSAYARDDDDECYVEGNAPTCFNCRGRRWVPDGFSCTRGLLCG